jgi:hypothetical protein
LKAGLPDGLFSKQKSQFGQILEGLRWESVGIFLPLEIFYGHLGYSMAIWYIIGSFGTFFLFWYFWIKKNLATLLGRKVRSLRGAAMAQQHT